ncbi:hypothetical protein [Halalkalibacter oceani]|uniref:hypothetical protein n=1 Tax=Halalkalibacter oceani TaxID=1653776 RepID=UPI0033998655
MEEKFFSQLKSFIFDNLSSDLKEFIGYYETLYQNKGDLSDLLSDSERYYLDFNYEAPQ